MFLHFSQERLTLFLNLLTVEDFGREPAWLAYYFNTADFEKMWQFFQQYKETGQELNVNPLTKTKDWEWFFMNTLCGLDASLGNIRSNRADLGDILVLLYMKDFELLRDHFNWHIRPHGSQKFMDAEYQLSIVDYIGPVAEFFKAMYKKDLMIAKQIAENLIQVCERPFEPKGYLFDIFHIDFYILFTMITLLNDAGIDCGEPTRVYKEWQKWVNGESTEHNQFRSISTKSPASGLDQEREDIPLPSDASDLNLIANDDGHVAALDIDVYPEDIGYCFTTMTQLKDIPLKNWFSEDGAFQDECGVEMTIGDVLGKELLDGNPVPDTLKEMINDTDLLGLLKHKAEFLEFLRHVALHGTLFTVEQPDDKNGRILQSIRAQLPPALSQRVLDALAKQDVMRIAFDDTEIREAILPAMKLARKITLNGKGGKKPGVHGMKLSPYLANQLDVLIQATCKFFDENQGVILVIYSEM